jgi:hypothetical protein
LLSAHMRELVKVESVRKILPFLVHKHCICQTNRCLCIRPSNVVLQTVLKIKKLLVWGLTNTRNWSNHLFKCARLICN